MATVSQKTYQEAQMLLQQLSNDRLLKAIGYLQALIDTQDEEYFTEDEEQEILTSYAQYKNGECEEWKPYQTTR